MSTLEHDRTTDGLRDIVLVGAGHTHVQVLSAFADAPPPAARVTLVVDTPVAVYSGMIPGLVAGRYESRDLEIDARPLAHRAGARVVHAAATGVDPERRRVHIEGGSSVGYDVASLDIGSTVTGLELPGVARHALATRPIGDFVRAISALDPPVRGRDGPFRIAVVGGGAAGVELAFTLDARWRARGGRAIETVLVHAGERVLGDSARRLAERTERALARRGIRRVCGRHVRAVEPDRLVLDAGETVQCDVAVWATGPASHGLLGASGLPTDERGFVRTRSTLQVSGYDDLFAVGDCAALEGHADTPKAGVHAVRQGPILVHNLRAWLERGTLRRYRPQRDYLKLLNLGDGTAIGEKWGIVVEGRLVMWLKDQIDRRFVRRFQVEDADRDSPRTESAVIGSPGP